ncbi:hypothetical protein GCM10009792_20200 [Microcella alkalica]
MESITFHLHRSRDESVLVQITVLCGGRPDAHSVIREGHVQRFGVAVRVHGNRLDAGITARANYADRNLTAIRDKHSAHGPASSSTRLAPI